MAAEAPGTTEPAEVEEDAGTEPPTGASSTGAASSTDAAATPSVRVHHGRLERRVAPLELSPAEALRLADQGPAGLPRRQLPPDVGGDGPGGSGGGEEG